jgi:tRNA(fMet)-specific endonuclease VapC
MIYLLDTDTVSLAVRKNPTVIKNLIKHENDEICISVITYAEICFGLEKKASEKLTNEVKTILEKFLIIDFNSSQSELYGKIRLKLEKSGTPLGDMDVLIAAAAMSIGAILVSHNLKHFSKITGINIEDWSK